MAVHQDALTGALQENVLTLVCYSDQHCALVRNAIPSNLFSTFLYRDIVDRVYAYIDKYKKAPGDHLADLVEDLIASKEKGDNVVALLQSMKDLSDGINADYVVSSLERFIRQQTLKLGIIEGAEAIQQGDLDRAETIIEQSMKGRLAMFNPGMTLLQAYADMRNPKDETFRLLTSIPELDRFDYGPARKELCLFMAPAKRGKSWWLTHLAKCGLMQRWKVLVITLELSEELVGRRMLQSLFSLTKKDLDSVMVPGFQTNTADQLIGINQGKIKRPSLSSPKDVKALGEKLNAFRQKDNLRIKAFPTGSLTINQMKAYLDALEAVERFTPDLIVLDYADLMKVNADNLRISLGMLYKELRGVAVERNIAIATASQSNRAGADAKTIDGTHVAEDYSKIAICDSVISYNQTAIERELKLARLFTLAGRNDTDRYTVLITQAYEIGQFMMSSRMLDFDYWNTLSVVKNGLVEKESED